MADQEPLKTTKQDGQGRPEFNDEQYQSWLSEMRSYLEKGNTIYYACERSGLQNHYDVILNKYKLNDWFSRKVDAYRLRPGEMINDTLTEMCYRIQDALKKGVQLSKEDYDLLKFMAEKHRTSQPFFVTRTETAVADPSKVGKILDTIESDYGTVGQEASKQMVADGAPVQDKK